MRVYNTVVAILSPLLLVLAAPAEAREIQCGATPCANNWSCWTVSVTYRVNVAPQDAPPDYRTKLIEFLHSPGNVWQFREDAECHARKAAQEGIMGPLNWPDNTERQLIPPAAIEGLRIWQMPPEPFASASPSNQ